MGISLWGSFTGDDDDSWISQFTSDSDKKIKRPSRVKLENYGISNSSVKQIACGMRHCVFLTDDGSVYTFGGNGRGQLGNNSKIATHVPQRVMGGVKVISAGRNTTMVLKNNGDVYTWGDGVLQPTYITNNVKSINCNDGSMTAIKNDNAFYVWGSVFERRSDSTMTVGNVYKTPQKVADNVKFAVCNGLNIAYITQDSTLYMNGDNYYGQLGQGTSYQKVDNWNNLFGNFVQVKTNVKTVDLGRWSCTAVDVNDKLYHWGRSDKGDYYTIDTRPLKMFDTAIASFASGSLHTTFLSKAGKIFSIGTNKYYAFGDGTNNEPSSFYSSVECLLTANPTATYSSPKNAVASVGTNGENESGTSAAKMMSFSNLIPNTLYNVYSVKDRDSADLIGQDNLVYIDQVTTDGNGAISFEYIPSENTEGSYEFAVPSARTDISGFRVVETTTYYNGAEQYYSPLIFNGEKLLQDGKDYIITGKAMAKIPGEYSATIVGKGLYKGTISRTYSIVAGDLSDAVIERANGYPKYNFGDPVEPKLKVVSHGYELQENIDYTVTYRNNINVGDAFADIEGIGYFTGSNTFSFYIQSISLSEYINSPIIIDFDYYDRETNPLELDIEINGKKLVPEEDYYADCYSDERYGYCQVRVYGIGNYYHEVFISFRGDVDWNNFIDGRDLQLLQKYLNSTPEEQENMWINTEAADMNKDGEINEVDVKAIEQFLETHRISGDIVPEGIQYDSSVKNYSFTSDDAKVGEVISVPVYIDNNPGFSFLRLSFSYDKSKLAFAGAENGELLGTMFNCTDDAVFWNSINNIDGNDRLVTLRFKVIEEADSYDILYKSSNCVNSDMDYLTPELSVGTVTAAKTGDTNGDGQLTIRDATAIQRHLAEYELLTPEQQALADTNGDGSITIDDVTLLQMYLAEYDVTLG